MAYCYHTVSYTLCLQFGALGGLDPSIFPRLQASVLPVELARDMMVNPTADDNVQKTLYSLLLGTMVFSCGLPLPVTHYQSFNSECVVPFSLTIFIFLRLRAPRGRFFLGILFDLF